MPRVHRPDIGPAIPWADEPLHSTLGRGAAFTVYQAVIPPGASTLLHSHVGVTAYVVVSAPPSPIRTETVEWACEETDGDGPAMPARLVPGQMALAPGAAFAFVVPDPRRPLVHRIFCPPGEAPARIVGVEVRGGGGREEGPPPPPPAPPFTVAASGPGFRTLRTVLAPGEACGAPAVRPPAVAITVRGGGAGLGGPPASLFVRAARADQGVAWTEGEVEPGCTLVNGGPGEWECCIVELL